MRADNSHHLRAAAHRRALATRERAVRALRRLDATGHPITFDTVAQEASVSRSWLYSQPDLRAQIQQLRSRHSQASSTAAPSSAPIPGRQRASDASLRHRLQVVNAEIRGLREENRQLREQLAWAYGELRAVKPNGQGASTSTAPHVRQGTIGPCS